MKFAYPFIIRCVVCVLALSLCQSRAFAEILFEKPVTEDALKRHEVGGYKQYLDKNATDADIRRQVDLIKRDKKVFKIELLRDLERDQRLFLRVSYLGKDLIQEAEDKKWAEDAVKRLSSGKDVGRLKLEKVSGHPNSGYFFPDNDSRIGYVMETYSGPKRDFFEFIEAKIFEFPAGSINNHEFLRRVIREDCRVQKTAAGWVIASQDKWAKTSSGGKGQMICWLSGDRHAVFLGGYNLAPDDLVPLYGKKFPSKLSAKFTIDKTAWGREDVEIWLRRMKAALDRNDAEGTRYPMAFCFLKMTTSVYVPVTEGVSYQKLTEASLEAKRIVYEGLLKWWQENKDKTYWHTEMQTLVAKGQSPEDLKRASEKRQQEEIKARLDAPLRDLKELTLELQEEFEMEQKKLMEQNNPKFREGFEKVAEGKWKLRWRSAEMNPWTETTYEGPKILETRDKRYPFIGKFIITHFTPKNGQKSTDEQVYTYDKLLDKWYRGSPRRE
jgi:hypothetical protein